jgi:light-regulated signal transduction histidine kinase (bacteriophytochrome)
MVIQFNRILQEKGIVSNLEIPVVSQKGRDLWCNINAQVVSDNQGEGYVYAVVEDITERKQSELHILELNQALELRRAELEAANKELEAFSYSVSHDLRAPLRAIDGFSQAILEDYQDRLDSTGQDYLRRLRAAAQRMGHLIDDMLQLSRITRADLVVAEVDLSAMAIDIATELTQREPQRVVDFRISPDLITMGDAQLLRIALTNLFENAWKFTARREISIITFASRDEDQGPIYFIQDNGVGFDMAYVNKLFQAFQRLHDAREFPGTGIGLAIVHRVIQKHGGKIWAQAEPESGATFYFSLQPIIKSV